MFEKAKEAEEGDVAAAGEGEDGKFWTSPEGGEGGGSEAAAATAATASATATGTAEKLGVGEEGASGKPLPPFLGRRPAAASHGGGVERAGDERGESVAG